ncbi:MAG: hypothetical protein P1T08_15875 [Acidimicrobiia bacterium]|nr:hypothetical protein [Acidimicrobiia bacterium]
MRGIHRKRFRGRIAPIDRPDLDLDIELWVEERGLTLARRDKPLGTWPIGSVEIDRVGSSRFVITLDGEHSAFIAHDPIAFSYEGLKAIATAKEKTKKSYSGRFKRHKNPIPSLKAILVARVHGLDQTVEPTPPAPPAPPSSTVELPPVEVHRPAHITAPPAPRAPDPVVPTEPADPYATVPEQAILEPELEELVEVAPGFRRHPGVFDRVRNARNGVVHEHLFTQHAISGGLVRRVCNECGHVSIDLSE